jgi:DNA-binding GntR family transcriptional regulator
MSTSKAAAARSAALEAAAPEPIFVARLSKESLSQQAYVAIRDSLMRSRLKPGQRLVLRSLARDLGISATPVREALLRLVSEKGLGMDERGTVVVPVLTRERFIEIRDLRINLEGEGAARAAELAQPSEVAELEAIHGRYMQAESRGDFAGALEENENFHLHLCRMARSPVLFSIVESLWMQFGPTLSHLYDRSPRPFAQRKHRHLAVVQSLRRRDREQARRAIGEDILIGGRSLLVKFGS